MFWLYPLPAGIGPIIIILALLSIPSVPMGITLGILVVIVSMQVILSGKFLAFATVLVLLPAIFWGRATTKRTAKRHNSFIDSLTGYGCATAITLPITSGIGLFLLYLMRPSEKQYLFLEGAIGDPVATQTALTKWHESIEACGVAENFLGGLFFFSTGFVLLVVIALLIAPSRRSS